MTMPNFLILGTIKAGTTSLYHYLKQHPDVFMSPVKEPKFFAVDRSIPLDRGMNRFAITERADYEAQFESVAGQQAVGEASPQYLWSPVAPSRIHESVPAARLIAGLRNPVERAFSAYMHLVREGAEPHGDFSTALAAEAERIADGRGPLWRYVEVGMYSRQVERYLDLFERRQLKIYLYEDLCADPATLLQELFRFLEVDDSFTPDIRARHNVSGTPRSRALQSIIRGHHRAAALVRPLVPRRTRQRLGVALGRWNLSRSTLPDEVRGRLIDLFREDVLRLQDLIGRDLTAWLR